MMNLEYRIGETRFGDELFKDPQSRFQPTHNFSKPWFTQYKRKEVPKVEQIANKKAAKKKKSNRKKRGF